MCNFGAACEHGHFRLGCLASAERTTSLKQKVWDALKETRAHQMPLEELGFRLEWTKNFRREYGELFEFLERWPQNFYFEEGEFGERLVTGYNLEPPQPVYEDYGYGYSDDTGGYEEPGMPQYDVQSFVEPSASEPSEPVRPALTVHDLLGEWFLASGQRIIVEWPREDKWNGRAASVYVEESPTALKYIDLVAQLEDDELCRGKHHLHPESRPWEVLWLPTAPSGAFHVWTRYHPEEIKNWQQASEPEVAQEPEAAPLEPEADDDDAASSASEEVLLPGSLVDNR